MFKNIYQGKKVFLTGHTGFKGSWLLFWLYSLGAQVKGYALAPENEQALYYAMEGDSICDSVIADIRDMRKLEKEITAFEPDFIFHLAAQPLVRLSYELPEDTFEINVLGTSYVLNATRKIKKPCAVIIVTTDKVYENMEWIYPYRETDRLGGLDPYSASKACAEILTHSYIHSFFPVKDFGQHKKAIVTARAGNVIGGGDWAKDRLIPDIVRALSQDKVIQVRNPFSVRPWQHVLEPLSGYLKLGECLISDPGKYTGSWNFGPLPSDHITVEEFVREAISVWGKGEFTVSNDDSQPHEAGLLSLDISKSLKELRWSPKWTSAIAIKKTLQWYKASKEVNLKTLLAADIKDYTG